MLKFKKVLRIFLIALVGILALILAAAVLVYPAEYVYRVVAWQESDAFDWQKFPAHPLNASPQPYLFDVALDPRVETLFEQLSASRDWDSFLEAQNTQAFIVIQDGKILYENYFNNTQRDSIVTSFSVAKSVVSTLIGKAIEEGYIQSVNDPITIYLPELAERDPRFHEITIRHLLLMASGLEYEEFRPLLFNSDDTLTSYYPDQRKISLENTHILESPGQHFSYNKYHPQLLGMILERATGLPVTSYLQTRVWDELGMEFDGSWSTDSLASDFEKMETGVNAHAIDFAKLGVLFLNRGSWQGKQVISEDWVDESTRPLILENYMEYYPEWVVTLPGQGYYNSMWWGMARDQDRYDFMAEGDKGQFIYISPHKNLIIVRNGTDFGIPSKQWIGLFYEFASQF